MIPDEISAKHVLPGQVYDFQLLTGKNNKPISTFFHSTRRLVGRTERGLIITAQPSPLRQRTDPTKPTEYGRDKAVNAPIILTCFLCISVVKHHETANG